MTDNPWTVRVKCQSCDNEPTVNRPGEIRPGWLALITQSAPLADKPPQPVQLPFCSLTCVYKWVTARLPSKGKENHDVLN